MDADVGAENEKADGCDGDCQCENEPHRSGMANALLRTVRCQQPSTAAHQEFAHQQGNIGERAVGGFLSFRSNGRRVFVHSGRIERFSKRKDGDVNGNHDVVRMNGSF